MKSLVVAPKYPLPEDNGAAMRTMNFVRYFHQLGDVDLLCEKEDNRLSVLESPFRKEFFINFSEEKINKTSFLRRVIDKLVHRKTWLTSKYTPKLEDHIRNIVSQGNYNYILCRYISEAYPLLKLNRIKSTVILDIDDIVIDSLYDEDTKKLTGISRINKVIDKQILKAYFKKCLSFKTILLCSREDRNRILSFASTGKPFVVPNVFPGMSLPPEYETEGYKNVNHMLFVGNLKYEPNCHGIMWFINKVFPKLNNIFNDVRLSVVGRNPPGELIKLIEEYSNIEMHINPSCIVPFYERCGVVIVPLFAGGGTRIKILEAGFANRPVLSTAIGAYGLDLSDNQSVLIFNSAESFIEKYTKLKGNQFFYSKISHNLSDIVNNNFSLPNFYQSMDMVLQQYKDHMWKK